VPAWLARAEVLIVELGGDLPRWPAEVEHAALEALVSSWRQAVRRAAGAAPPGLWQFVSAVSGGGWLGTTTTPPWAGALGRDFISATSSTPP
jgi:hypothetical protein